MTFGQEFDPHALVARERYDAFHRDADAYRLGAEARAGIGTLVDRLGTILLAWGCRLCERRGTVTVHIEVERRHHPHAA